jgi:hypothetical protein
MTYLVLLRDLRIVDKEKESMSNKARENQSGFENGIVDRGLWRDLARGRN